MVFAGDELGLEGAWGEDARRTMPWDRPETLGRRLLDEYRRLIALRRSSDALARGGIRYAPSATTRSPTCARRAASGCSASPPAPAHEPIRLSLAALGCRELETAATAATRRRRGGRRDPAGRRPGVPRLEA